jgi:hypothetical protein
VSCRDGPKTHGARVSFFVSSGRSRLVASCTPSRSASQGKEQSRGCQPEGSTKAPLTRGTGGETAARVRGFGLLHPHKGDISDSTVGFGPRLQVDGRRLSRGARLALTGVAGAAASTFK